jgi:hypothetical protein
MIVAYVLFKVLIYHEQKKSWLRVPPKHLIKLLQICSLKVRRAVAKLRKDPAFVIKALHQCKLLLANATAWLSRVPWYLGAWILYHKLCKELWGLETFNKSLN